MKKRAWSELPTAKKSAIVIGSLIEISLLVAVHYDLRRRSPEEINGSKALWMAVSFVNFFGPLAYFAFGRKRTAGAAAGSIPG